MKKFLIGCFGVLALLVVLGGGLAWFKLIKPGMELAGGIVELGQRYDELNKSIENRSSFDPPARLDPATFQRFLAAQRLMRARLEERIRELDARYKALEAEIQERGGEAGIGEMIGAYSDLTGLLIEAKQAQVDALNAQGFSLGEYNWVRGRVYRALGQSVAVPSVGRSDTAGSGNETRVPDSTRNLVGPYRSELMENYALVWWGL